MIYSRNIVFFLVGSSRLDFNVVAFCLRLSVIRKQQVTTILLLRRLIRAPDQISDWFYVISIEFLSLSRRLSPWPNVLSREEQGANCVCFSFLNVVVYFYALSHHMTLTSQTSNASKSWTSLNFYVYMRHLILRFYFIKARKVTYMRALSYV